MSVLARCERTNTRLHKRGKICIDWLGQRPAGTTRPAVLAGVPHDASAAVPKSGDLRPAVRVVALISGRKLDIATLARALALETA